MTAKRGSPYWSFREVWHLLAISWLLCAACSMALGRRLEGWGTAAQRISDLGLLHLYPALGREAAQFGLSNTDVEAAALHAVFDVQAIFLLLVSAIHLGALAHRRRSLDLDSPKVTVLLPALTIVGFAFIGDLCSSNCTLSDDRIDPLGIFVLRRTVETSCISYMVVVAAANLMLWFGGHQQHGS